MSIGTIIGAIIVGAIFGLITYFFGRSKGQERVGIIGGVVCLVGGLLFGLFAAVPLCVIFIVVEIMLSRKA